MFINKFKIKSKVVQIAVRIKNAGKGYFYSLLFFACFIFSIPANAQCAMCRAALTSSENSSQAAAVNDGIVYLMVIPYLLVAGIGYAIYRMKKKKSN